MLENIVALLGDLCLIALPLLISFCIVGSIVAALRAVSRGSASVSERREEITMGQGARKNWRELCKAALNARDPDELLEIVQELNKVLKREEQIRRDFREAQELTSLGHGPRLRVENSGRCSGRCNPVEAKQFQRGARGNREKNSRWEDRRIGIKVTPMRGFTAINI
jgi:hypothetical protein